MLRAFAPNVIAFFSNMAIMVLELVAGRLAARNVGSSNYTWISIICVILAGMSLGNWYGGRLADRHQPRRILWRLFLLAAGAVLLTYPLNLAVGALKSALIPLVVEYPHGSSHLWGMAVFVMMGAVFFLPALVLGVLSPVVSKFAMERQASSARALGSVHSWGAVGAVLGTFLTGFVLVSAFSVTVILLLVAGVLALIGVVLGVPLWRERARLRAAAGAGVVAQQSSIHSISANQVIHVKLFSRAWCVMHVPHLAVFLTSLCLMAVEMVASRFVARSVGSSLYTWTLVIGVVFIGMSLGNYLGGRLAARNAPRTLLGPLFLFASLLCASLLWTNQLLTFIDDADKWPETEHRVYAELSLDEGGLRTLGADGLAAEKLAALRPLLGERHPTELVVRGRVAALLPDASPAEAEQVLQRAVLRGPTARILREHGVPPRVIARLASLLGNEAEDASVLRWRLRRLLEADDLEEHRSTILDATRVESPVLFPVRLGIGIFAVFLLPALALGLLSPVLAQLALERGQSTGRTVGNVYAWGAWGSIIGTFFAGFFLVSTLGSYGLVAATALLLALLAVGLGTPRLLGALWFALVAVLAVVVFHQRREPDALDTAPARVARENRGTGSWARLWDKLPALVGEALHLRDPSLGVDATESDYEYIGVQERVRHGADEDSAPSDVKTLLLDNLMHGFLAYKMPPEEQGQEFDFSKAVYDPSAFEYPYLGVKAVLTARLAKVREEERGSAGPVALRSLTIGGGSYTFPRYFIDRYPGERYLTAAGETLRSIGERRFAARSPTAAFDFEARARAFNGELFGAAPALDLPLPAGSALFLPSLADVAELDPVVTRVNQTRFGLLPPDGEPRIRTWSYDARNFVESAVAHGWTGRYDVIYGDAVNHFNVPFHLTTSEFNAGVRALLAPRGLYLLNVIDSYQSLRFVAALLTTLRQSFQHAAIFVERDPGARLYRSTFVLAASDSPIDASRLGGVSEKVLAAVKAADPAALAQALPNDATLARELTQRLAREGAAALHEALLRRKRVDLQALYLEEPQWAAAELAEDHRLLVRAQRALSGEEADLLVVLPGRARRSGVAASVLAALARPAERYRLGAGRIEHLAADGVPTALCERLRALADQPFEDADAFSERLLTLLPAREDERYLYAILQAARVLPALGPPVVLTDEYAPVDGLLLPLLQE